MSSRFTRTTLRGIALLAVVSPFFPQAAAQVASHRWGGFVNALWFEPMPLLGGSSDAFSVWTAEDGCRIRRYDSWTGTFTFETVTPAKETLHDLHLHTYAAGGTEVIYGVAVGTRGAARQRNPAGNWIPFPDDPAPGKELWACSAVNSPGSVQIWVAGADATLRYAQYVGTTWTGWSDATFTTPPAAGSSFTSMDFSMFSLGTYAIAGTDAGEMFYTSDGQTWHKGQLDDVQDPTRPLIVWDIDWRTGSTTEAMAVGGRFEGNGEGFAWHTLDGGQTWTRVPTHFEKTGIAPVPNTATKPGDPCTGVPGTVGGTNTHLHYVTLYGVHMFENGEAIFVGYADQVWKYLPSTGSAHDKLDSFAFTTGPIWGCHGDGQSKVWISGQFGVIRSSDDRGESWLARTPHELWRLHDIAMPTASTGYVVGQSLRISKTTDGGATWQEQRAYRSGCNAGASLQRIAAYDANSAVAIGGKHVVSCSQPGNFHPAILVTANGGASCGWQTIDPRPNVASGDVLRSVAVAGVHPATSLPEYWICGRASSTWTGLLRSSDGGLTWSQVSGPDPDFEALDIDFLNRDTAIVVGRSKATSAGRAYLTLSATSQNPGWIDVKPPFAVGPLRAVDLRGISALAVGDGGVVLEYDRTTGIFGYAIGMYDPNVALTTQDLQDVQLRQSGGVVWVYASGNRGVMFRSVVGTSSWAPVNTATTDDLTGFELLSTGSSSPQVWLSGKNARWGDSTILTIQ